MPVSAFSPENKELFDYFNRILIRAGKEAVPANATIARADLDGFVQLAADSKQHVHATEFSWRSAVTVQSNAAVKEINQALRDGRRPPYPVLPAGAGIPAVKGPYDMISLHRPAGSGDRFLIELPEQVCAEEAKAFREAREAQAAFFEGTLRPLFRVPTKEK